MVREPIREPVGQLQIQGVAGSVEKSDGAAKTGGNSRRGDATRLGENGVVVHKLVLWVGELKELGVDGVDGDVLWFPRRPACGHVAELVKGRCAADKRSLGKVVVDVDEPSCGNVSVEVQNVDRVHQSVTYQARGNVRDGRHGLDVLVLVHRDVNLGEQGSRAGNQGLGERDGGKGVLGAVVQPLLLLHVRQGHLPWPGKASQRPPSTRLGRQLFLEQPYEAEVGSRALVGSFWVERVDQGLERMRLGGDHVRLVEELGGALVALAGGCRDDIGYCKQNNLDQLGADCLQPANLFVSMLPVRCDGGRIRPRNYLHLRSWPSAARPRGQTGRPVWGRRPRPPDSSAGTPRA